MTPEDIQLVAALCKARAGMKVDPAKTYLMESRLAPLARREGYGSIEELIAGLKARREEALIWAVVEAMTLNETAFFRDKPAFEQIRDDVLPTLSRLRGPNPIRIWSAGCATGQEAYSLAMIAEEGRGLEPGCRIEIYGSDLSERCLEKAQSGVYTQFEVQRGLPIRLLIQHFEKIEENWRLSPRIRQRVRWRRLNLAADLSAVGRFDLILCRYVLGALDEGFRQRVLEGLAAALPADGVLILGEDESIAGATNALRPVAGRPGLFTRDPSFRVAA
ncbi:CheR family methyltransferase [Caulobacter mirabilis]|uniref:protein-glutamate O-methyltransferase n=1 Tax=Caulobacter mirabilis TaxID=69666 RepID=A0A2D2ASK5_9CAUL|nr:protein-glutamate O-methyltransferase CheR [Caulobacter mirabilis]ATQ40963.1 chemotaxis protein CheR [Caulobacter mirabilis]